MGFAAICTISAVHKVAFTILNVYQQLKNLKSRADHLHVLIFYAAVAVDVVPIVLMFLYSCNNLVWPHCKCLWLHAPIVLLRAWEMSNHMYLRNAIVCHFWVARVFDHIWVSCDIVFTSLDRKSAMVYKPGILTSR